MSLEQLINFPVYGDERGSLVSLQEHQSVPFDIKRVYYIFGTLEDVGRGYHAHKQNKQLAVCVSGSCRFVLDDGRTKSEVVLDSPNIGLIIDPMIWHEMYDFTSDCVLLVLASEYYDEADYIRDYQTFKKVVENGC